MITLVQCDPIVYHAKIRRFGNCGVRVVSYTVLVADDEPLATESVVQMIRRNFPKEVLVEACSSGKHAIERAGQVFPDIIIMDIRMFGINGLEAIRIIRGMNISTEFIIMSAYDYFEYAQEAISLGVSEYLLKPFSEEQLRSAIRKLIGKRDEQAKEQALLLSQQERIMMSLPILEASFCHALSSSTFHKDSLRKIARLMGNDDAGGYVMLMQPLMKEKSQLRLTGFCDEVCHYLKRRSKAIAIPTKGRIVALIICDKTTEQRIGDKAVSSLLHMAKREGIPLMVGIGQHCGEIGEAQKSYQEAYRALLAIMETQSTGTKESVALWHTDLMNDPPIPDNTDARDLHLSSILDQPNPAAVIEDLTAYLTKLHLKNLGIEKMKMRMTDILLRLDQKFAFPIEETYTMLRDIMKADHAEGLLEIIQDAFARGKQTLDTRFRKDSTIIIDKAEAYIMQHYMEAITLEQVARAVNLSQHYFSRFFKQAKGISYSDYLTEIRMNHAKSLVTSGALSIKEVAYQTGFQDPNYFSKKFKLSTGLPPSRYKRVSSGEPVYNVYAKELRSEEITT